MNNQLFLFGEDLAAPASPVHLRPPKYNPNAIEMRVQALRETAPRSICCEPAQVRDYWHASIPGSAWWEPHKEHAVALLLNTRRHIIGHHLIATGILDTILIHPRETFRAAIIAAASAIILTHNHPSGDPTPSEADIRVTRELMRAGQLLKMELIDHVIIGRSTPDRPKDHLSLRELGYFHT